METVVEKFERMGARATLTERGPVGEFQIDIASDHRGEYFDLRLPAGQGLETLDVRPKDRHLVLMVRGAEKQRFLCGHDERAWFVAAIPEGTPVTTVSQAKEALKPPEVRRVEHGLPRKLRGRRRNPVSVRQGEWFFVPAPDLTVSEDVILRHEPLARGRGRPHLAEEAVRIGGETVYTSSRTIGALTEAERDRLLRGNPAAAGWGWRPMVRNPTVYVRGRITHPDHRTVVLRGWHRVLMNTEHRAGAMRQVAFVD